MYYSSLLPSKISLSRLFGPQMRTPPYSQKAMASNRKATVPEAYSSSTTLHRNLVLF